MRGALSRVLVDTVVGCWTVLEVARKPCSVAEAVRTSECRPRPDISIAPWMLHLDFCLFSSYLSLHSETAKPWEVVN